MDPKLLQKLIGLPVQELPSPDETKVSILPEEQRYVDQLNKQDQIDKQNKQMNIANFLEKIAAIESSGGTNLEHKPATYGLQRGHTALGKYGLMPNTIEEVINRNIKNPTFSDELKQLKDLPLVDRKELFKEHPEYEQQLAEALARKVVREQGHNPKAAYAWLHGHNLSPDSITPKKLSESGYARLFEKLSNNPEALKAFRKEKKTDIK